MEACLGQLPLFAPAEPLPKGAPPEPLVSRMEIQAPHLKAAKEVLGVWPGSLPYLPAPRVHLRILLQSQAVVILLLPSSVPSQTSQQPVHLRAVVLLWVTTRKQIGLSKSKEDWGVPRNLKVRRV